MMQHWTDDHKPPSRWEKWFILAISVGGFVLQMKGWFGL
jgi:hypothetical protein